MKWSLSAVFVIAWALWFGGAVTTLLFVQRLFHGDRNLALVVAPQLFVTFEKYQFALACAAVMTLAWVGGRRCYTGLIVMMLIAAVTASVSAFVVTPHIEQLRLAGAEHTSAFGTFHGLSMLLYLVEVLLLLVAGLLLAMPASQTPGRAVIEQC